MILATRPADSGSMSATATRAPRAASSFEIASPTFRPAPVTRTVRPAKVDGIRSAPSLRRVGSGSVFVELVAPRLEHPADLPVERGLRQANPHLHRHVLDDL